MKAALLVFAVLIALPPKASAEGTPFRWPAHTTAAARISDGLVASAIALDTWHQFHAPDRKRALLSEGCRLGLTLGVTEIVKRSVHRVRPDGSDAMSFWSGHTATAMQASGWRYSIGVPIALGAGYFRMAAGRHYASDVAAGAGMGLLAQALCRAR